MKDKYDLEAAYLLRTIDRGVLSTVSKKFTGYPFGSFTTFTTNRSRTIIIYASDLAQHTVNLKQDSKACLTIYGLKSDGDKQDSKRLSLIGDLVKIEESADIADRFMTFLPHSVNYSKMHDFNFYKLVIKQARWIGGFGQIAWLKPGNWEDKSPKWQDKENSIIEHMNDDHSNSIISTLHAHHKIKDKNAKMIALNIDGYYIETNKELKFIAFNHPCLNLKDFKDELVRQAHEYREFEL